MTERDDEVTADKSRLLALAGGAGVWLRDANLRMAPPVHFEHFYRQLCAELLEPRATKIRS